MCVGYSMTSEFLHFHTSINEFDLQPSRRLNNWKILSNDMLSIVDNFFPLSH